MNHHTFITEHWLREQFGLAHGTEVQLPANARLTPSAQGLLDERHITVKYIDDSGRVFIPKAGQNATDAALSDSLKQVHPLTTSDEWSVPDCLLCQQKIEHKPDTLTHIDAHHLVSKNDPRLLFRGKLDSVIAQAVLTQIQLTQTPSDALAPIMPQLSRYMADVRSALGNVLKAEATGETMATVALGNLSAEAIHKMSHHPLKYLGHDHLVPDEKQGMQVALLNLLRTQIREAELYAAQIYITRDFRVKRPDIMQALNRLSSAVYVLMLVTHLAHQGKCVDLEQVAL